MEPSRYKNEPGQTMPVGNIAKTRKDAQVCTCSGTEKIYGEGSLVPARYREVLVGYKTGCLIVFAQISV
jgi:hypothetical protein